MIIAPVSFRYFASQNLNYQQRNTVLNIPFKGYDDESGYKLYKSSVPLITQNGRIYGKTYVKDDGSGSIEVKVTDNNGKDVGEACVEPNHFLGIKNYYKGKIRRVGTAAYDSLFSYIKKYHPEIREVKANCTNEGSYRFHIAYGFTDGYKNDPDGYDCCSVTNILTKAIR